MVRSSGVSRIVACSSVATKWMVLVTKGESLSQQLICLARRTGINTAAGTTAARSRDINMFDSILHNTTQSTMAQYSGRVTVIAPISLTISEGHVLIPNIGKVQISSNSYTRSSSNAPSLQHLESSNFESPIPDVPTATLACQVSSLKPQKLLQSQFPIQGVSYHPLH